MSTPNNYPEFAHLKEARQFLLDTMSDLLAGTIDTKEADRRRKHANNYLHAKEIEFRERRA